MDEEVELQVDSLAYGGNGVARLNGFVVFVRKGLPGDRVRARVTKVKRGFAEALGAGPRAVARSASTRRALTTRPAAAAAFRTSTTRPRSRRRKTRCATPSADRRDRGAAARADPPEPSRRSSLPQQDGVLVHADAVGATLGFHRAGRWDEVLEIEKCWLTTDLGNAIRNAVRDWAREEKLVAVRPGPTTPATCATSSSARAATPDRRSSCSSPRRARSSSAATSSRCSGASRRCARSTGR